MCVASESDVMLYTSLQVKTAELDSVKRNEIDGILIHLKQKYESI